MPSNKFTCADCGGPVTSQQAAGIDFSLYLRPSYAARNQLPDVVQTAKRPVRRPEAWK